MKHFLKYTTGYLFLILLSFQTKAQVSFPGMDSLVSKHIDELGALWSNYNSYSFEELLPLATNKIPGLELVKLGANENHGLKTKLIARNKVQQRILKKDPGLSFSSSYAENFRSPIADPEDVVVFKRRATFGLDWDILKFGLYDNRQKIKLLEWQLKDLEQSSIVSTYGHALLKAQQQIMAFFNERKLVVINKRASLNKQQMEVIEKLWSIKQITKDDYLKAIQNKTDVNGQLELYQSFSEQAAKLNVFAPQQFEAPLLDIDFDKLLQKIITTTQSVTVKEYLNAAAKIESNYWREVSLKAYARYNYYDVYNFSVPNRSFVSVGMNLNMPLAFNQKDKKDLALLNYEIQNSKPNQSAEEGLEFLVLNYYYEYRYKLKQYFNLLEKRNVFYELIRTERVKQELNDVEFNPNKALLILDDYWSTVIELLDLHQQMFRLLLDIRSKLPETELAEYTFVADKTSRVGIKIEKSTRALYVWSKSLQTENTDFVHEYIKINEITDLLLSYKTDKEYLEKIKKILANKGTCQVHLMVGNNKLLFGGLGNYLDTLSQQIDLAQIKGIHLDIEPQAFDDFKENKTTYFQKYLLALDEAYQFKRKNNKSLSVSIPLNYPDSVLNIIYQKCDQVYLMSYENVNVEFLKRKWEEELKMSEEKSVIAFRAKDFKNREEMESLFEKIKAKHIAYHDLETMKDLDKKSIQIKEDK